MSSIWINNINLPGYNQLNDDIKTDVLIIGGGITGLLCAYMLKQSGVDCVVAEANRICSGVSKNTTAKITSQHGLIYHKIAKKYGIEKAKMYLDANEAAIGEYRKICRDIDCDFEVKDAYVYTTEQLGEFESEIETLNKIGFNTNILENVKLPFSVSGAIKFSNHAQFHPLKFITGILDGIQVYENTRVLEINEGVAFTEHGKIKAENIIVSTHFPFINKHGSYFMKQFQERSYLIAVKDAENVDGMYIDGSCNGLSFRNYKDYLLIGGGSHRTGRPGDGWSQLVEFAHENYPDAEITHHWATQDCISLDEIPYIGQYSKITPGMYVATGFNKWGMTSAMNAAMILRDKIIGVENEYADVFDPSRSMLHKQILINGFDAAKNLMTPSSKRCPHLGCALKWNPQEHSWDCPCHGSRFEENGKLINDPAQRDVKV